MLGIGRSIIVLLFATSVSVLHAASFEFAHLVTLSQPLSSGSQIAIQTPVNASFKDGLAEDSKVIVYENSGDDTMNAFKTAFAAQARTVKPVGNCQLDQCLSQAKSSGSIYLVIFDLTHWEERSTIWSGKPDRLTVEVSIYDTASDSLVARSFIHANSSISKSNNGTVAGFLHGLADQYIASLY